MEDITKWFRALAIFMAGILLGLIIGALVAKHQADFWYLEIKRDQKRMSVEIKRLNRKKMELLNRALKMYYDEVRDLFRLPEEPEEDEPITEEGDEK